MSSLDCTAFYHSSTSLCLQIFLPWLHFTMLYSVSLLHDSTSLYLIIHYSTMVLIHFTSFYCLQYYHGSSSLYTWLYWSTIPLLHFIAFHNGSSSLHLNLPYFNKILLHSTWNLHYSTMSLLHSTSLYFTLLLYTMTVLHNTWLCIPLLHSSWLYSLPPSLYFTLTYLIIAVYFTLPDSTDLQYLYFTLLDFTSLYHCSTSLYLIPHRARV